MPEDLKLSQIGSFPLPPPFTGRHSPGVRRCRLHLRDFTLPEYENTVKLSSPVISGNCLKRKEKEKKRKKETQLPRQRRL